jgi:glycerol-3-phosphate dehydrogenase
MSPQIPLTFYDVVVVGAGINGSVSAAALSARGLSVLLVDQRDFGGLTSSQSSNLIWGGIKYLQSYEFGLVFKLSRARAKLMRNYPTKIVNMGFFAALGPNAPFGQVLGRFGTLFYWAIGLFSTPTPNFFAKSKLRKIEPTVYSEKVRGAVEYFDGVMPDNDSRFVWDFVSRARELGATVRNYHQVHTLTKSTEGFEVGIENLLSGQKLSVRAKVVINAAGPFAKESNDLVGAKTKKDLVFSKGIHLVVRKITSDSRVLTFWDEQGRIFYVIPMHDRSVIGTTDTRVADPLEGVSDQDREFVLRQINLSMTLDQPLRVEDIISERCGVRALVVDRNKDNSKSDWHKLSRKHRVETDPRGVISILGGKFTDCINVGEEIVQKVRKFIPITASAKPWFGEDSTNLKNSFDARAKRLISDSLLSEQVASQLWRRHGIAALEILERLENQPEARELVFESLPITFGELSFIAQNEEVRTAEDLLRRRLPIAMVRSEIEIKANKKLQSFLNDYKLS